MPPPLCTTTDMKCWHIFTHETHILASTLHGSTLPTTAQTSSGDIYLYDKPTHYPWIFCNHTPLPNMATSFILHGCNIVAPALLHMLFCRLVYTITNNTTLHQKRCLWCGALLMPLDAQQAKCHNRFSTTYFPFHCTMLLSSTLLTVLVVCLQNFTVCSRSIMTFLLSYYAQHAWES